jgi:hypothetical protein
MVGGGPSAAVGPGDGLGEADEPPGTVDGPVHATSSTADSKGTIRTIRERFTTLAPFASDIAPLGPANLLHSVLEKLAPQAGIRWMGEDRR